MLVCENCSFNNPVDHKFCSECGAALQHRCPECGFVIPPQHRFCGRCGYCCQRPAAGLETAATGTGPAASVLAERRQLTVMFCDLADYTMLADSMDPEELRVVLLHYQQACEQVISRFGGHIAQYLGDGILVYFGYPTAHEDDARRAVYSALGCVDAVVRLNEQRAPQPMCRLALRIGIHTGLVVTGEIGAGARKEQLALGRTPTVAARLQELAQENTILFSADTARLVHGYFDVRSTGIHTLKGIANPVEVFQVLRETDARDRFDVALRCGGVTPFVGRASEIDRLGERWRKAAQGEGQAVVIRGEAGVGKSRLIHAFHDRLKPEQHAFLLVQGVAYAGSSSFRPIIDMLENVFGFERQDDLSSRFQKMERVLKKHRFDLAGTAPLFGALLGLTLPDDYQEPVYSPDIRKKRTVEALFALIERLTLEQPLLMVVEDLQWLDPSTLELLDLVVKQGPTQRMLVIFTCRPSFSLPWYSRSHFTEINLSQLSETEVRAMISRLTGERPLPEAITAQIVARTDGIPLFVEELTKTVIDSGVVKRVQDRHVLAQPGKRPSIPATLQDSLMARLDRLGKAKEVAQLAAMIGREFSFELLHAVSRFEEPDLDQSLSVLLDSELVFQRGVGLNRCYIFKHALVQEAAIQSLLKSRRQTIHLKIARVVEQRYPEIARTRPEYLAFHYAEGGDLDAAVDWWVRAGKQALMLSANIEAIAHLENALNCLGRLPDTARNRQRELHIQTSLGPAYCATLGYAAPQVERTYSRARHLCQEFEDSPQRFPMLWGYWAYSVVRGDLAAALENAGEMQCYARQHNCSNLALEANMALGLTHYFLGRPREAVSHLRQVAEHDTLERDRSFTFVSGQDAGVCGRVYLGLALWLLGDPQKALHCSREAVTLARRLKHPFSLAYALNFSAWLRLMLQRIDSAVALAKEQIALSEEHGFFWVSLGKVVYGWCLARRGAPDQGAEQIQAGLEVYRATGARLSETFQLAVLADVALQQCHYETAQGALDQAFAAATQTGERFWLAELHRLSGLLLERAGGDGAREQFEQALLVAREQGMIMLELRASASLARYWLARGQRQEAAALLLPLRERFADNDVFPDLEVFSELNDMAAGRASSSNNRLTGC